MESSAISRRKFVWLTVGAVGSVGAAAGAYWRWGLGADPGAQQGAAGGADTVAGTAKALGSDLARIFAFVRSEIRYEPYAGVLRGARGTLLTGAGNSLDQALLLAELLKASSLQIRFVSGPLDPRLGQTLLASTSATPEQARQAVDRAVASPDDLAKGIDWTRTRSKGALPKLSDFRDAFAKDATAAESVAGQRLGESVAMIERALTAAGITLPGDTRDLPSSERTAHTWVQVKNGSAWVDLDPCFADAQPGKTFATGGSPVPAIADSLRHKVTFVVVLESLQSGRLTQQKVIEVSSFVDQLSTTNVEFLHVPADKAAGINILGGSGGSRQYAPVLAVGEETHVGRQPVSIGAAGAANSIADAFGGGGSTIAEGESSAEWLEVRVASPGSPESVARRTVFDLVSPDERRGGKPSPDAVTAAELVDVQDGAGSHFLPCRTVWAFHVTGSTPNLKSLFQEVHSGDGPPLSLLPAGYHVLLSMLGVTLASRAGCRPLCASPQISSWVFEPGKDGFAQGLDIWHRSSGALPITTDKRSTPAALVVGVLAHTVERFMIGDADDRLSVGMIFDKAVSQGVKCRAFRGRVPDGLSYEPAHLARIQAALAAGKIVVAPERPIDVRGEARLGWWLIDPTTGAAVDELDNGRGGGVMQGTTDNAVVVAPTRAAYITALSLYGWHVMNLGMKYIERYGPNAQVSQAISDLFKALMAMCPPGRGC